MTACPPAVRPAGWHGAARDIWLTLAVGLVAIAAIHLIAPPYWGHDMHAHERWQVALVQQLLQGDVYPRWLASLNEGFGSPAFFVYPPLAHAVSLLFLPIAGIDAATRVRLAMLLAMALSGVAMLLWLRTFSSRRAAIAGAVLYMLAPYHVYIDLYRRAALSELWAFVWVPLALLALRGAGDRPLRAFLACSPALAGLLLTHPPSSLVLIPAFMVFVVCAPQRVRSASVAIASLTFAALLAAIYLLPALTHEPFTNMAVMFNEHMTYHRWLFFGRNYYGCSLGDHIHACQLTAVIVAQYLAGGVLLACALATAAGRASAPLWAACIVFAGIAFMLTAASAPVWDLLPLLQKMQFPWRMMAAQTLVLGVIAAIALDSPSRRAVAVARCTVLVTCLLLLVLAAGDRLGGRFGDKAEVAPPATTLEVDEYQLGDLVRLRQRFGDAQWSLVDGDARVRVTHAGPRRMQLHVEATRASRIALRQYNDTGWRDEATGTMTRPLSASEPVATLDVAPGTHDLDLRLVPAWPERVGRIVSLLALGAWIACFILERRGRRHAKAVPPA